MTNYEEQDAEKIVTRRNTKKKIRRKMEKSVNEEII